MTDKQEAVIIRIKLSDNEFGEDHERMAAYEVEDRLLDGITPDIGEVDGHEFGDGFATIFLYGPSADALTEKILPILSLTNTRSGSFVTKRYGPPGANEQTIAWPSQSN